jgi:hypothetical protein
MRMCVCVSMYIDPFPCSLRARTETVIETETPAGQHSTKVEANALCYKRTCGLETRSKD